MFADLEQDVEGWAGRVELSAPVVRYEDSCRAVLVG